MAIRKFKMIQDGGDNDIPVMNMKIFFQMIKLYILG